IIFLCSAVYNLLRHDFPNAGVAFFLSVCFFAVFRSRARINSGATPLRDNEEYWSHCCRCGTSHAVERRAYSITYSLILLTSKSHGSFKPICEKCKVIAGLPHSLFTLLVGWWGIPWGPIYTIQTVYRNFRGGVLITDEI
ncbi:MAG: hypothetical protein V4710_04680, partial [Verrucomicrobiota bacterium]